ncbi:hypothetical protein NTJ56_00155 [Burkholderia contaminans]|uniref:hypothetical protein n=1 Tax=Burkholderia contaminans TaxID=488447 RepID=UPI001CF1ED4F|nr:hypothetical protein [Burkholderia contaminans]MCA7919711.1 hypothetical protein [Burkholderia contaminans]UUX37276.1 hypothetical protein NTJ56_00155 [Burkholderia contaminans]
MSEALLARLDALDIDAAVRRFQRHPGDIVFEQRVSTPEADVLCCRYQGERFNVKFGLDYGVFVDRVGKLSGEEAAKIVGWLAKEAGRSPYIFRRDMRRSSSNPEPSKMTTDTMKPKQDPGKASAARNRSW